jgi:MFS family permease
LYKDAIMINAYMIAGNILLTIPIGMALDRFNKIGSLVAILIATAMAIAAIPFVITSKMLTIIVFLILSAATGGIYVTGISMLTDKFHTKNLVMANTVMLMMNAIGGFAGVSATGAAIQYWGHQGLIISLFVLVFFFLLFVVYSFNGKEYTHP